VEITCARLIDCVAEKLEFLKGQENFTENQETFNHIKKILEYKEERAVIIDLLINHNCEYSYLEIGNMVEKNLNLKN
jgi:hypothetical protein